MLFFNDLGLPPSFPFSRRNAQGTRSSVGSPAVSVSVFRRRNFVFETKVHFGSRRGARWCGAGGVRNLLGQLRASLGRRVSPAILAAPFDRRRVGVAAVRRPSNVNFGSHLIPPSRRRSRAVRPAGAGPPGRGQDAFTSTTHARVIVLGNPHYPEFDFALDVDHRSNLAKRPTAVPRPAPFAPEESARVLIERPYLERYKRDTDLAAGGLHRAEQGTADTMPAAGRSYTDVMNVNLFRGKKKGADAARGLRLASATSRRRRARSPGLIPTIGHCRELGHISEPPTIFWPNGRWVGIRS